MAFALVAANRGSGSAGTVGSTFTFRPSAGTAQGNLLVLVVSNAAASGSIFVLSVTDSKSNSWHVDVTKAASSFGSVSIISTVATAALTTGDVVTVNTLGSSTMIYQLSEFSGAVSSNWTDQVAVGSGTSTTPATGTSGTLAQATELVVAGITNAGSATTYTPGAGYTSLANLNGSHSSSQYQILSSSAGISAGGTFTPSSINWTAALATYKSPAPPPRQAKPIMSIEAKRRSYYW